MNGLAIIFRREVFSLFISPATYVVAFYYLILLGVGFRFFLESFVHTDWILPPLASLVVAIIFGSPAIVPFLTMRSLAEEKRLGTLEILLAAPVSATSIVLGKWAASYFFFVIVAFASLGFPLLTTCLFPKETSNLHLLEQSQLLGGSAYLMSAGATFTSIGIFASSITRNQMVAGMLTFTLLALQIGIMTYFYNEYDQGSSTFGSATIIYDSLGSVFKGFDRLEHFVIGFIDFQTIFHFVLTTVLFLAFSVIATERTSG